MFAVAGDVAVPVASLLAILRVGGECKTIVALVRWRCVAVPVASFGDMQMDGGATRLLSVSVMV